ncbi:MAG TPA: formate/nitrite transporter family protein [Acetobacteraceae bacterium]|nr:formate/nitrite transporter family protein [Acetobacteraceae bacterium]
MSDDTPPSRKHLDHEEVKELSAPRAPVIHEVVRRQGEEELDRPNGSLFWSGLAAGITIMASVIAQGALHHRLPDLPGRDVIACFGYCIGFLMVILGRMQLFTEQTIVTVLPVMAQPSWQKLWGTARLWVIVFVANMLGTAIAAAMNVKLRLVGDSLLAAMLEVAGRALDKTPSELLTQAIPAGFLIASVAWIRAALNNGEFWIVLALTYTIAIGEFTHVIAGAAETFLLLFAGRIGTGQAAMTIGLALTGNVIGGTGLFALLAHAQVRQEL